MDLKLAFVTALLMAMATILIRAVLGKKVAWLISVVAALSVLLPLVLIVVLGVIGMLEPGPEGAGKAASDTITAIVNYIADNLPGLVISAVAGAVVGFLAGAIKKAIPKRLRTSVARRIRL